MTIEQKQFKNVLLDKERLSRNLTNLCNTRLIKINYEGKDYSFIDFKEELSRCLDARKYKKYMDMTKAFLGFFEHDYLHRLIHFAVQDTDNYGLTLALLKGKERYIAESFDGVESLNESERKVYDLLMSAHKENRKLSQYDISRELKKEGYELSQSQTSRIMAKLKKFNLV